MIGRDSPARAAYAGSDVVPLSKQTGSRTIDRLSRNTRRGSNDVADYLHLLPRPDGFWQPGDRTYVNDRGDVLEFECRPDYPHGWRFCLRLVNGAR